MWGVGGGRERDQVVGAGGNGEDDGADGEEGDGVDDGLEPNWRVIIGRCVCDPCGQDGRASGRGHANE